MSIVTLPPTQITREAYEATQGKPLHRIFALLQPVGCPVCGAAVRNLGFADWVKSDGCLTTQWGCTNPDCSARRYDTVFSQTTTVSTPEETHMTTPPVAVDFDALHQYSDDGEIVSLVRDYANDLREGIITSPGKFEGEPIHTVYFYGWLLQGEGDTEYVLCEHAGSEEDCDCESEVDYTVFHIGAGDVEAFPLTLAGLAGQDLRIREDSNGFVYSWVPEPEPTVHDHFYVIGGEYAGQPACQICRQFRSAHHAEAAS